MGIEIGIRIAIIIDGPKADLDHATARGRFESKIPPNQAPALLIVDIARCIVENVLTFVIETQLAEQPRMAKGMALPWLDVQSRLRPQCFFLKSEFFWLF